MGDLLSFGGRITRSGDRNTDEGGGRERDRSESPEIDRFVESLFFTMIHPEKKEKRKKRGEETEENDIFASAPPSPSTGHRKTSPRRQGHSPIPSVSGSLPNTPNPYSPTSPPPPPSTSPPYLTPPPVSPPTTTSTSPPPTTASISSRFVHLPPQRVTLAQSVSFDSPLNHRTPSPSSSFAPTRPVAPRTLPVKRPASSTPPHLHKLSMLSVVNLKEAFKDGEAGKRRVDKNGVVMDPLKPFSLQLQREKDRLGEC